MWKGKGKLYTEGAKYKSDWILEICFSTRGNMVLNFIHLKLFETQEQ